MASTAIKFLADRPGWTTTASTSSAKIPAPPPRPDTLKSMLQALLADRFKLTLHKDDRPVAGYVLSLGKGKPKLKEADGSGESGCKAQPQTLPPATPGVLNVPLTAVRLP